MGINTEDPAFFHTDLAREHALADSLGIDGRDIYAAGVAGALCDDVTRERLRATGATADWSAA